jgi:16S rRNA (guanine1516-N2)-methyltransferase
MKASSRRLLRAHAASVRDEADSIGAEQTPRDHHYQHPHLDRCPDDGSLEVSWPGLQQKKVKERPFRIDFTSLERRQQSLKSELVVKAIGKDADIAIDLTAGLGRDGLLMASAGLHVMMMERNPTLYALLKDAETRLQITNSALCQRISIQNVNSADATQIDQLLQELQWIEDVSPRDGNQRKIAVYLDPMYSSSDVGKKSAVKKETQVLHRLVSRDEADDLRNTEALMRSALALATTRVVVKRALKAEPLLGMKAHQTVKGSTQRFDIYFKNQNPQMPVLGTRETDGI